ncbi:MAG: putative membrane protein [Pelotomaculum thermopropionicum]|uniref:Putative membrane protein n=1 Tax=Pelotomaculum thermopropionicum TaxID=110500 RepID=A0A101HR51_9FIRM|nr:MAG: putative membrane protein [Pelotomaculum thermopropionicum]
MKLTYICECCDAAVEEIEILPSQTGGMSTGLTGTVPQDIINTGKRGALILTTLCDDCREMVYGGPENSFFERPGLH